MLYAGIKKDSYSKTINDITYMLEITSFEQLKHAIMHIRALDSKQKELGESLIMTSGYVYISGILKSADQTLEDVIDYLDKIFGGKIEQYCTEYTPNDEPSCQQNCRTLKEDLDDIQKAIKNVGRYAIYRVEEERFLGNLSRNTEKFRSCSDKGKVLRMLPPETKVFWCVLDEEEYNKSVLHNSYDGLGPRAYLLDFTLGPAPVYPDPTKVVVIQVYDKRRSK